MIEIFTTHSWIWTWGKDFCLIVPVMFQFVNKMINFALNLDILFNIIKK